jgi:ribonuclease J
MSFKWWSLGGLGEVGMNCMAMQFGTDVVPIDAGILFASSNDYGIESLHPNFEGILSKYQPKIWLITHAHEDHIGAISGIFQACRKLRNVECPEIWAPPFSAALIREKCIEDRGVGNFKEYLPCVREIELDKWIEIKPGLRVCFIEGRHSTLESCSLAFEWNSPSASQSLKILHSSDFKIDSGEYEDGVITPSKYRVFGEEDPDILFVDSTNSERPGHSVSELDIEKGLRQIFNQINGRVYVSLFSSNVYRIALLAKIGASLGRKVCLAGRSMETAFRVAQELDLIGKKTPDVKGVSFVGQEQINKLKPSEQFVICSGSQGENRSTLMRLASQTHSDLQLEPGDGVVLSSKVIPGNEKTISRLINGLLKLDAKVFWGDSAKMASSGLPVHASGHARSEEIALLVRTLRPRNVVPVHGEMRQLKACSEIANKVFKDLGNSIGDIPVVENHTQLEFRFTEKGNSGLGWNLVGQTPLEDSGRILRFDGFTSTSRDPFLWVRKQAALNGVVSAVLSLTGDVSVQSAGIFPQDIPVGEAEISKWVASKFKEVQRARNLTEAEKISLERELSDELARFIKRLTGMKPFCFFHILENQS